MSVVLLRAQGATGRRPVQGRPLGFKGLRGLVVESRASLTAIEHLAGRRYLISRTKGNGKCRNSFLMGGEVDLL